MFMNELLKEKYSPMYFLSALGAGGLSVSFFMYLMFLVEHKGVPLATFDFVFPALVKGDLLSAIVALALVGIIIFAFFHFKLLAWNIKQYKAFKTTKGFEELRSTNAEVTLMAMPLTFAMTINVCFVLGAVFVPGLWSVVEFMFPFAILGFAICGYYALKIFMEFFSRIISTGSFDCTKNNNFSQMISIFAFSMISVGFAAPGAMSHHIEINAIGILGSIFFMALSVSLLVVKFILGFRNILERGLGLEAAPSLWIVIPILTLLGIALIRITFGLHHGFETPLEKPSLFMLTSTFLSFQILAGVLGYKVMKKLGYFDRYVYGNEKSVVSFALICPGVAFMVFGMFFINFGLAFNGVIDKYSIVYFALMAPFVYIQYKTVNTFFILKKKFFG
jgi:hypothetical protein